MTKEKRELLKVASPHIPLRTKERIFAQEYVKQKNVTRAALAAYDTTDAKTASVIGSENLLKPRVNQYIEQLLAKNGITTDEVLSIHARNARQEKHLPTSQKAVESFESMLGLSEQEANKGVNIAFIIEQ